MEKPDLLKVTKILTSGTWFEIKAGSLKDGSGIQHVSVGGVHPLYRFQFPDGQEGAILARCLDGWAPLVTGDLAAPAADMSEFRQPAGVGVARDMTPAWLNRP